MSEAEPKGVWPHSTTEEIEAAIVSISEAMKGPLPNAERMLMHEDRKEMRAELARRKECKP